jgi:uncharacterized protein (DUF2126 family)
MSIQVALNHRTAYHYDRPVQIHPHVFRLRPAPHTRTPVDAYSLKITPSNHFVNWQQDPFGNFLARAVFPQPAESLTIEVDLVATLTVINPFDFFLEESAEFYPFDYEPRLAEELRPYLAPAEAGELLRQRLRKVARSRRRIVDFLVELNRQLSGEVAYMIRMEPGVQSCEQTLKSAAGSCRDSAWLLVQMLRHLGLAARFVSGYLIQLAPDVKSLDGPSGPAADFTDLHAWAEVFVPGAGWLGLDPTSGLFAGEGHIPLACTPSPESAAPVTGATGRCESRLDFENSVRRIREDPRVTRPYTEEQWRAIDALGHRVDAELREGGVRLTMGGEPTFVSIDDMDSAEWNVAADGPGKRRLALALSRRLQQAFAPGGVRQFGQGKWYPGEPLPRWQVDILWRPDGEPLWREADLLGEPGGGGGGAVNDGRRLIDVLAGRLGVPADFIRAGYEDPLYHAWQEALLPVGEEPAAFDPSSPIERRKLAEVFERGLGAPAGWVLPLQWDEGAGCWRSSAWDFRRRELYLVPGNSPMGLRLPLDSLRVEAPQPAAAPPADAPDEKTAAPPSLADIVERVGPPPVLPPLPRGAGRLSAGLPSAAPPNAPGASGGAWVARTALCVEPRDGCLFVFLPPAERLEAWLALLSLVEQAAVQTGLPVALEGYPPPDDPRLRRLSVSPDPGVIEVNVHPSGSWPELSQTVATLYREARQVRLGTEKFMLDGRHSGTGGGNHLTLGGPSPAASPFLQRPELLRSLITYWQHHPGLSYLFSGLFIGPTSQAPRVDEARNDQLYELEIAFDELPRGDTGAFWMADRLLRNLLIDASGNTHRAEFSIDKLYPLDPGGRRLGLVELRAFEMPPHYRMSLVQMLLVRALIARFWSQPYRHRLVRWGTELHDRFMLPHYVRADLAGVVEELQQGGRPFELAWLDPFFEFRFPKYGSVQVRELELELRMAVEPWHVLGEEVTRAGAARFVDSSVERLQVRVCGLTDPRFVIACNGRRVPLRPTGVRGEHVAGVRYRAWQPPSALHPTIGVHSPLVFDIIDTWNGRSIGGCTYHVSHPGGRSYDVFPVNAYEAESRRISRFQHHGHTPGPFQPPPPRTEPGRFVPEGRPPGPMAPPRDGADPEYPCTLDLRRQPG